MKSKSTGFSLIELLVVILLIGLLGGISIYSISKSMNTSKEKRNVISIAEIKKTGSTYILEKINNIYWISDEKDSNIEYTCVSIPSLINYGYFTNDIYNNDNLSSDDYIKINRNKYSKTIDSEDMRDDVNELCKKNFIEPPKCNVLTYNGNSQTLLSSKEESNPYKIDKILDPDEHEIIDPEGDEILDPEGTDAGSYKIKVSLSQEDEDRPNIWSDGSKDPKDLKCEIKKKELRIRTSYIRLDLRNIKVEDGFYSITDTASRETIFNNLNAASIGLIENHKITNISFIKTPDENTIGFNNASIEENTENKPVTDNYKISYEKAKLTSYSQIKKPTAICTDPEYTGDEQAIAEIPERDSGYSLQNHMQTEKGKYEVIVTLDVGYIWEDKSTEPINFTCRITDKKILVTFDPTGGKTSFTQKSVIKNEPYGKLPTLTKTGYTGKWYTAKTDGSPITENTVVTSDKDHTLYAQWTGIPILVTANANGGTIKTANDWKGTGQIVTKTITFGNSYGALPIPERSGYTFTGWYTASSGGSQVSSATTVTNSRNHTIYAQWTTSKPIVTFDPNKASINNTAVTLKTTKKQVTVGTKYGTLPAPTATGYKFAGWYTKPTGGSKVTKNTKVTIKSDHKLYAHWTATKYTITANANGGTIKTANGWTTSSNKKTATKDIAFNSKYGKLPVPERDGYKFAGWYTAASGGKQITNTTIVTTASNHTIYAHWELYGTLTFSYRCIDSDANNCQRITFYVTSDAKDSNGKKIKISGITEQHSALTEYNGKAPYYCSSKTIKIPIYIKNNQYKTAYDYMKGSVDPNYKYAQYYYKECNEKCDDKYKPGLNSDATKFQCCVPSYYGGEYYVEVCAKTSTDYYACAIFDARNKNGKDVVIESDKWNKNNKKCVADFSVGVPTSCKDAIRKSDSDCK